jgi:hypothetical protein
VEGGERKGVREMLYLIVSSLPTLSTLSLPPLSVPPSVAGDKPHRSEGTTPLTVALVVAAVVLLVLLLSIVATILIICLCKKSECNRFNNAKGAHSV